MTGDMVSRFSKRLGYSEREKEMFREGGHRVRHVNRLAGAAALYSIEAEVVQSRHCNSGHQRGQKMLLDIDGNFITKLCPKRMCVYLVSQLTVPVALINERLSEGHAPEDFHFMRQVRCLDVGVECLGFGEVMMRVKAVSRVKRLVN